MSGGPELHSRRSCEALAHRIEKMSTRDRLCEHCFPTLKMLSRETVQRQLFSGRVLENCLTTSQLVFAEDGWSGRATATYQSPTSSTKSWNASPQGTLRLGSRSRKRSSKRASG